jgi:GNAT superfamily N-acetyltransferase
MIQRNLERRDLAHLPGLLAALDREPVPWDVNWLQRKIYGDPDYDPALSPLFEAAGRPVALVHGAIRDGGQAAFLKVIAVERTYRRQGLASQLLDIFESRARAAGATRIEINYAPPTYLVPALDPGYTGALALLLRRGYQTDRETIVNMEVKLSPVLVDTQADEARLSDLGYTIRRALPADREEAVALGYRMGSAAWQSEVQDAFNYDPVRLHIALNSGAIVAFAAQDVIGPLLFGPTATDPAVQRLGIGTVLLKRCLADALGQGYSRAIICGAGPLTYYIKTVGARICRYFWTFEKSLLD